MFKAEKTIKFLKSFSSPTIGNVYEGKFATLPADRADKFISAGLAEEAKVKKDGGHSKPVAGKSAPSRNAK